MWLCGTTIYRTSTKMFIASLSREETSHTVLAKLSFYLEALIEAALAFKSVFP